MKNVGFIGWRGMVGSVLMQRMVEERDFDAIRPVFFSTSQLGQPAPSFGGSTGGTLQDAFDLDALKALDIIVTCRGGDYTNEIYPKLRASGWQGYWIDAASSLRMKDDAIIILDPVNRGCDHRRPEQRRENLCRRQLHRQPDADVPRRPVCSGSGGVGQRGDVPGGFRRRRASYARAAEPDGAAA